MAVHPDKSCIINFVPDKEAMTWWSTHAALSPKSSTLPAGLPGHYFVMNSTPEYQRVPFVCSFVGGASDAVILAYKVVDLRVYAYGVTVDKIIAFKPPRENVRTSQIDEATIFSSYKLPHVGIVSVKDLANTETHKLRDMVDNMIQFVPLFRQANIKSLKDLDSVESSTVQKNISRACDAAEMRLRKQAKDRGTTSKDANESAAGGMEAQKVVSDTRGKLTAVSKWYETDLEDRFFFVATPGGGSVRLTDDAVAATREAIEKSSTLFAKELTAGLENLAELSREVESSDMLNFVQASPMEHTK